MKYLKTMLASILLLTGVLIGSSASHIPLALADPDAWSIVSTPNVANVHNVLQEVTVINNSDVWAVGYSQTTGSNGVQTALAMHYNGSSWTMSTMNIGPFYTYSSNLFSVAASSSNDVWAVGQYAISSTGPKQTFIMHWNGSIWVYTSPPSLGNGNNVFNGVAVVSSSDVWAVGSYDDLGVTYSLTEHWNGSSWSVVSSPNPTSTGHNVLYGVTAIAFNDVWASGITHDSQGVHTEFLLHWDNNRWTVVPGATPILGALTQLYKIRAIATNDIWTVGYFVDYGSHFATLTEHWDGTSWGYVPSPNGGASFNILWAVGPVEHNAVWSVGYFNNNRTLTEYYAGSQYGWSTVSSPNVGAGINRLFGVSITPGGSVAGGYNAWAVGFSTTANGVQQTLAMVYNH